jgi:glycerophosphoryl diester phosphodiesterase
MKKKTPIILAHRGYSQKFPENTLLAFNKAFENNADGIECDLQKSKDNIIIFFKKLHEEPRRINMKPLWFSVFLHGPLCS